MFCRQCGAKVDDSKNFCPQCGASVARRAAPAPAPLPPQPGPGPKPSVGRKLKLKLIIAVAVVAVVTIAGIAFATGVFGEKPYEGKFTLTNDSQDELIVFMVKDGKIDAQFNELSSSSGYSYSISGDISKVEQTDTSWVYTTDNPVSTKEIFSDVSLTGFKIAIPKDISTCGNDAYWGLTMVGSFPEGEGYVAASFAFVVTAQGDATAYAADTVTSDYQEAIAEGDMLVSGFDFDSKTRSDSTHYSKNNFTWSHDSDRAAFEFTDGNTIYGYKS